MDKLRLTRLYSSLIQSRSISNYQVDLSFFMHPPKLSRNQGPHVSVSYSVSVQIGSYLQIFQMQQEINLNNLLNEYFAQHLYQQYLSLLLLCHISNVTLDLIFLPLHIQLFIILPKCLYSSLEKRFSYQARGSDQIPRREVSLHCSIGHVSPADPIDCSSYYQSSTAAITMTETLRATMFFFLFAQKLINFLSFCEAVSIGFRTRFFDET